MTIFKRKNNLCKPTRFDEIVQDFLLVYNETRLIILLHNFVPFEVARNM